MKNSRGFTLVELVIAILLLSVLAFFSIPRNPGQSVNTVGLSDQLLADIRYVQSLSMTRGQRYCISFSTSGYQLGQGNSCGTPIAHPATGTTGSISLGGSSLSWTNLPNSYLVFNGKGVPYTDASTVLAADATVTIVYTGGTRVVTVSPETGRSIAQ